jgi:hypothetical protein
MAQHEAVILIWFLWGHVHCISSAVILDCHFYEVLCSELSSGLYCRVKWLSTDVSEVRTASIIRDEWTSYSPPWELEISHLVLLTLSMLVAGWHHLWLWWIPLLHNLVAARNEACLCLSCVAHNKPAETLQPPFIAESCQIYVWAVLVSPMFRLNRIQGVNFQKSLRTAVRNSVLTSIVGFPVIFKTCTLIQNSCNCLVSHFKREFPCSGKFSLVIKSETVLRRTAFSKSS